MKTELFTKVKLEIDRVTVRNQASLIELIDVDDDINICVCGVCGHSAKGVDFSFPTGGDDYEGRCPKCYADEDSIIDLDV